MSKFLGCDICKEHQGASGVCKECVELYCSGCANIHRTFKATKAHPVVDFDILENETIFVETDCDLCNKSDNSKVTATALCSHCREFYCDQCRQQHQRFRMFKNHKIYNTSRSGVGLEPGDKKKESEKQNDNDDMNETVPDDSVIMTSDFETFTVSIEELSLKPANKKDQNKKHISSDVDETNPDDSVVRSSVFEDFGESNEESSLNICDTKKQQIEKHLNPEDMDKISAEFIDTFVVTTTSDKKKVIIKGIICLKDGRLIVLDSGNATLKMFDQNLQLICEETTPFCGCGLAKVSEDGVAVVGGRKVYFYSVTADKFSLQKEQTFTLDADYGDGISSERDVIAVACNISNTGKSLIKFFSKSGDAINCIHSLKHTPGHVINLDTNHERLYISSKCSSKFSCISQQGQLQWGMDFNGVDVVQIYNCLLITDYSGAIVLCTKDGKYRRVLIQNRERLFGSYYITYNFETQNLFVSHLARDTIVVMHLNF